MGCSERKSATGQVRGDLCKAAIKRKQATSKKVISFLKAKAARRKDDLSDQQKEELVLEFRTKARKLARSLLRKWHARLDIQEVDSIVDLALCESVKRFDPKVGASFMTFLFYHLRGHLIRTITAAADASGYGLSDDVRRDADFYFAGGQAINASEVAEALSSSPAEKPDDALFKKELLQLSVQARTKLDKLELEVIERLYFDHQPLLDVADSLGYSRCHVSRVKQRALNCMRSEIEARLEADDENILKAKKRRTVYRRKPRSKKNQTEQAQQLNGDQLIAVGQ